MQSLRVYGKISQQDILLLSLLTGVSRGICGDQDEANSECLNKTHGSCFLHEYQELAFDFSEKHFFFKCNFFK